MRPCVAVAVAVLIVVAAIQPASAARNPVTVLLASRLTPTAPKSMTPLLWRQIVSDYVDASTIATYKGDDTPSLESCRAAGAAIAMVATFDGAPRLPGIANDPGRTYGIARFDRLNCLTGVAMPPQVVRVSSDPPTEAGDFEVPDNVWNRTIRAQLAREGFALTGIARIVRIDRLDAYIDAPGLRFVTGQVIRAFVDHDGKARPPVELVVGERVGKLFVATFDRKSAPPPHAGDFVEAAP